MLVAASSVNPRSLPALGRAASPQEGAGERLPAFYWMRPQGSPAGRALKQASALRSRRVRGRRPDWGLERQLLAGAEAAGVVQVVEALGPQPPEADVERLAGDLH